MSDHGQAHFGTERRFALALGLNLAFVCAEVFAGLRYDSLALLSDAGHNLNDALGLGLAWVAHAMAQRAPTRRHTYGLRHLSTLAALANALLLLLVVGGTLWEAVRRFNEPIATSGQVMMLVAGVGVVINAVAAGLFLEGGKRDLNLRGAYIHLAGDAAVSLGVVLAGLAIAATGAPWIDPAASILVSLVIVLGTWGLLRRSFRLAMAGVPDGVDLDGLEAHLRGVPGVTAIHDLHVWAVGTTDTALTVHVTDPHGRLGDEELALLARDLHETFGIGDATVQVERGTIPCDRGVARAL
jgi:cobalt-zinc-cadmium efflux system protein